MPRPSPAGTSTLPSRWRVLQDFFEFPRLNQRNVGGDHQRAVDAALHAELGRHLDGAGFSGIVGIGNDFEFIFGGQLAPQRDRWSRRATRGRVFQSCSAASTSCSMACANSVRDG